MKSKGKQSRDPFNKNQRRGPGEQEQLGKSRPEGGTKAEGGGSRSNSHNRADSLLPSFLYTRHPGVGGETIEGGHWTERLSVKGREKKKREERMLLAPTKRSRHVSRGDPGEESQKKKWPLKGETSNREET